MASSLTSSSVVSRLGSCASPRATPSLCRSIVKQPVTFRWLTPILHCQIDELLGGSGGFWDFHAMNIVSRLIGAASMCLTFAACAYVAYVDELIRGSLPTADRIILLSGFLVGAASAAIYMISFAGRRKKIRPGFTWNSGLDFALVRANRVQKMRFGAKTRRKVATS